MKLLHVCSLVLAFLFLCAGTPCAEEFTMGRDFTCFQTGSPYRPEIDSASDMAVVYGVGNDFAERAAKWREHGYAVGMMTGIAWGGYGDYYMSTGTFKKEEVQTTKTGRLFMHGENTGYNVPTDSYIEYIKKYIEPAVDAGAQAMFLEEPEYWAETGWSEAFKLEWKKFYGEDWLPPDSSVDAQYKASRLKYELYYNALREVFAHAKQRAANLGHTIECHVPTHSLINYAQWRIVSPESHLIDIPGLDGYIAQVWTGTARSPNFYCGVKKERTFETAYLEYGQMLGMVRPTGKKVWFLADPVEDNPNRSWNDYRRNYECTVIASLMWPEVHRYETMPWPDRIFQGTYPAVDLDAKPDSREGIPADYATEILAVINALNDMEQTDVAYETGTRGIGLIVSDTLMFQRAQPTPSEPNLGAVYGLALPLIKHGVPLEIVQLENSLHPKCLTPYKVLLLTYEGQKPLKPEYHDALEKWVREGGSLIYIGNGSDPYHHVKEWWNDQGKNEVVPAAAGCFASTPLGAGPANDLFMRLGVTEDACKKIMPAGKGYVRVLNEDPAELQKQADGATKIMGVVEEALKAGGGELKTQNYLLIRRGPYIVASVMDESVSDKPLELQGNFVDVLNPALPLIAKKKLHANERALLYNLDWLKKNNVFAKVVAAGARVKEEAYAADTFTCAFRGPKATHCNARILLPRAPAALSRKPDGPFEQHWDSGSSTLLLSFDNIADDVRFSLQLK